MTDLEICIAALTEWPEEARPNRVRWGFSECGDDSCKSWWNGNLQLNTDHAIALFRDSGLGWLMDRDWCASRYNIKTHGRDDYLLMDGDKCESREKSFLAAIDIAIRSLK